MSGEGEILWTPPDTGTPRRTRWTCAHRQLPRRQDAPVGTIARCGGCGELFERRRFSLESVTDDHWRFMSRRQVRRAIEAGRLSESDVRTRR